MRAQPEPEPRRYQATQASKEETETETRKRETHLYFRPEKVVVFCLREKRRVVNAWTKVKGREEIRGEEGTGRATRQRPGSFVDSMLAHMRKRAHCPVPKKRKRKVGGGRARKINVVEIKIDKSEDEARHDFVVAVVAAKAQKRVTSESAAKQCEGALRNYCPARWRDMIRHHDSPAWGAKSEM
jgi:hypothetical protein